MRDIVIDQKGCRLSFERNLLILHHDSFRRPVMIPFGQIQSLTLVSGVELTSTLLTKLAQHNIAVAVLSGSHGEPCFVQGKWSAGVARRVAQHDIVRDDDLTRYWANRLVKLKIHRQIQLLRRLNADQKAIAQLSDIKHKLHDNSYDVASLRGLEGSASAIYFNAYRQFFDERFGFNNRNRRPPLDPVNVILSLSYTLLQGIYENAVYTIGFDPYLGVLHEISYGRASLACDFTELQRCEIDYWVWQLFDNKILTIRDFSMTDNVHKPCELLKVGQQRFYAEFMKIKPILQKTALRQVWLVQKRLSKNTAQTLDFISEHSHEKV